MADAAQILIQHSNLRIGGIAITRINSSCHKTWILQGCQRRLKSASMARLKNHEIPLYESGVNPVFVFMLNVRVLAAEGSECYVLQEY